MIEVIDDFVGDEQDVVFFEYWIDCFLVVFWWWNDVFGFYQRFGDEGCDGFWVFVFDELLQMCGKVS